MIAHTPGPWHIKDSYIIVGPHSKDPENRERTVAATIVSRGTYIAEAAANAHLIAAAPDLLEALIHMVSVAERDGWQRAVSGRQLFLWDAKVAIAKAKGETP
jgi:hypothetical protein